MQIPKYGRGNADPGIDVYLLPEGKKVKIKRGTYKKKLRRGKLLTK